MRVNRAQVGSEGFTHRNFPWPKPLLIMTFSEACGDVVSMYTPGLSNIFVKQGN
jgi:hypothetical protein